MNPWTVAVAALSLTILLPWLRVSRRILGPFVALIAGAVIARAFDLPRVVR